LAHAKAIIGWTRLEGSAYAGPVKKTVLLTVSAVVLALAIAAGAFFLLIEGGGLPRDPLLLAPEETSVLVRVDMKAVKRSLIFKKLIEERGLDAGMRDLAEKCGYDLLGALSEIFAFVRPEGESNSIALVGSGHIDVDAAMACMRTRLAENQIELEETSIEGFRALGAESISARVAFVGSRGVVLGEEPMVTDILKRVRGEIPRLDAKSHLAVLYERMRPGRDIVLAAELPENWHRSAHGFLEPKHAYELMPSLMHLHEAGVGLTLRDGFSLGAVLAFDEEAEGEKAARVVETTVENMRKNVFLSLTPAGPALAAIKVESEGEELRMGLNLTQQQVEELLRVAKAFDDDAE
jgi:hypothetical protein